jgi:hypothetical protein
LEKGWYEAVDEDGIIQPYYVVEWRDRNLCLRCLSIVSAQTEVRFTAKLERSLFA